MYPIRINKFLTMANYCSRRQADKMIKEDRVKINHKIAELGDKVKKGDEVFVGKKRIKLNKKEKIYLAFNKPVGIICTTDKESKDNIIEYINYPERIYPIGRLDVQSSGLIFLTNDGGIVNRILKAQNKIEKEYIVQVNKDLTSDFLRGLHRGIVIDHYKTLPAKVKKINDRKFSIIITEGKNRQIRRMCEKFDYKVIKLTRIRIGKITLNRIKAGKYIKIDKTNIW